MADVNQKITWTKRGQNESALNAGALFTLLDETDNKNARAHDNLPHNIAFISNQDTVSTLFIFLNSWVDLEKPDFVLFPSSSMTLNLDDGVSFHNIAVYNTHASNNIAAKAVKYKISTVKRLR